MKSAILVIAVLCSLAICSPLQACGRVSRQCQPNQQHEQSVASSEKATKVLVFQLYRDRAGEWRWRLKSGNNRIIADSGEGYHNRADAIHAIELVQNGAKGAAIR